MCRSGFGMFLLVAVATACSEPSTTIGTSAEGLASFFTQECLDQGAADLARREWRGPFCLDECGSLDGYYRWEAQGDDGSPVLVEVRWAPYPPGGPPSGQLNCSVSVASAHADALRGAVSELQVDGLDLRSDPDALSSRVDAWRAPSAAQAIVLEWHESPAEFDARMQDTSTNTSWYRSDLVRRQVYPVELSVIYRK
jgi:hypothetical protein